MDEESMWRGFYEKLQQQKSVEEQVHESRKKFSILENALVPIYKDSEEFTPCRLTKINLN
ncbi:hypothetical protein RR46_01548 [Papilio xuthus]|uniref:Uncharacterized protein n=1 Tax=Papilio xuthus TaxID=66420 RepID=A0A0N0PA93_PAPXU|nr:hypothetical protein RR46_01548 [Papilio xuthus]